MSGRLVLIGLLLIGVAKASAWWLDNFNYVTTEHYVGYDGEARYNLLLAAKRLTEALGHPAQSRPGFSPVHWLPPTGDTVFIGNRHRTLSEEEIEALLDWVYQGGKLVAAPLAHLSGDEQNLLMDYLEVYLTYREGEEGQFGECAAPWSLPVEADTYQEFVGNFPTVTVEGREVSIDGDQPRLTYLDLDLIDSGGDDAGLFYLRFRFGEGFVAVVADALFTHNDMLGGVDNAAMLAHLITVPGGPGTVWYIYDDSYPSIASLVWKHAAVAVIAFALLLGLILWRISRRFGPLLPAPETARRSLLEHIQATGALLWSTSNQQQLVDAARGKLLQALDRHHPGVSHSTQDEQVQLLSEHTGQPAMEVAALFQQSGPATSADFMHTIRAYQNLWKKI